MLFHPGKARSVTGSPKGPAVSTRALNNVAVPPWGLAVAAMLSVQLSGLVGGSDSGGGACGNRLA